MSDDVLYNLSNVTKSFVKGKEKITVFDNLNMRIQRGDFLAIMGPSGSGKTTLLNMLGGVDQPTSGEVTFDGGRVDTLSEGQLAGWRANNIGFIFQFYNLMPMLNAARNVELPLLLTKLKSKERKNNVAAALELVSLADRAGHKPSEMSGGQQQRVAIARALVSDPKLLLCDEPTGDLDRETADEILSILQLLNTKFNKTIVMVTHDPRAAESKLRLFLTLFATFIAFMVYGLLSAFQSFLDSGVDLAADDRLVVLNKINFTQALPIAYVNRVRAIENVVDVVHLNWFGGYYQDPQKQVVTIAVDPESFLRVFNEYVMPEDEKNAWLKNRQGLIVGEKTAQLYDWKVGDRIPLNSSIFSQTNGRTDWDFDIVSIYSGEDEQIDTSSVYFHYDYFNETQSFGRGMIGWMGVRTDDPGNNEKVISSIDSLFENTQYETESMPEAAFNKAFIEQIGNLGLIISSVVLAAFFIILVIVGNSMVLAIRERTREIGVMKTLGFRSPRIFGMVLAESMMIALIGGLLGLSAARGIIFFLGQSSLQLPTLVIDQDIVLKAIGIMIIMGLITGIIPAINALRLNIVTSFSRT